jgi:hypothetical protein
MLHHHIGNDGNGALKALDGDGGGIHDRPLAQTFGCVKPRSENSFSSSSDSKKDVVAFNVGETGGVLAQAATLAASGTTMVVFSMSSGRGFGYGFPSIFFRHFFASRPCSTLIA